MNRTEKHCLWLPAFRELLVEHSTKAFEWGVHDCATIAVKTARLAKRCEVPIWTDAYSAFRFLHGSSLLDYTLEVLGDPMPWGDCIVGDIAIGVQDAESRALRQLLVVHDGQQFLAPDPVRGLRRFDESRLLCGWRID
jgi:hypothetical protein